MTRETRAGKVGEIRTGDDGRHYFTARICNYGVPDTYRTSWAPGVFADSLKRKLPTAVFAHQWDRPIGKVVSYEEHSDGLDVTVRMSDLDANPDAKRMYHHLKDREIEEFSFAFVRSGEEPDPVHAGVVRITQASLDEVSPVLVGSVPGTKTLSVRSGESVPKDTAADLLVKFSTGEIDLAEALTALKQTSTGEGAPPPDPTDVPPPDGDPKPGNDPEPLPQPDPDEEAILDKLSAMARGAAPKPYGNVKYADPKNGKYPIDTKEHVKAAWSYINMPKNASKYSPDEVKAIKGRIKSAAKKFGVTISE